VPEASLTQSQTYFARIEEVNLQGPALRAVIETNPSALEQAKLLDLERKLKGPRGPLHGIPILLKDNIATLHSEGMTLKICAHPSANQT
jgi:amidase